MPRSNALRRVPEPVREFVARRAAELSGAALLAGSLAAVLALVSWSARDPSLNHATSGKVRNLLGSGGAIVADISMQMLGVATIAAVLPLALLGARLLTQRAVHRPLLRCGLWIVGTLAAAAIGSLLPVTDRWPLPTGLGGVLGDALLSLPRRYAGESSAVMAVVAALAVILAIVSLTGAAGFGLETRPEGAHDEIYESERASEEDTDEEPGFALVSLGALIHVALTVKTYVRRRLAQLFARRPPDALDLPAGPPLLGARREPVFDYFSFAPPPARARAAPPAAAPAAYDDDAPPPATARVMEPAGPLKPGKRVLRERQPSLFEGRGAQRYELPGLLLLSEPKKPAAAAKVSQDALEQNARLLEGVLEDFGVKGEIINVRPGPVVTLYELEPAPGIKSSRVIGLADDIARSMSAVSARVAVVSGRNAIGIELPNHRRETVFLRELLACEDFDKTKHRLAIALGKTIGGEPVIVDLARMPHLLVAGTTGSGKSVAINTMILSLLYRMKPEECRLIMVDPKMLELSVYDNIPHLLTPVVTDPKKAVVSLKWAVREMEDRYKKMSKLGVRNIEGFNQRVGEAQAKGEIITRTVQTGFDKETGEAVFEHEEMDLQPLPFIVVIVDEMADLMLVAGKDIEGAIQRLAQMARAAGIHLIMATQRPSVDVITGTIKANFPTRISFQVTSKIDSRTILGEQGAEQLLGQGDMLYMAGGGRIARVHGPFVSDAEVEHIVAHLKTQGQPQYLDAITTDDEMSEDVAEAAAPGSMDAEEAGDLYDRAVAIVLRDRKCSTSYIQRRLSIGYNKAASLVEQMEREGVVGQANHAGKREILVGGGIDRGAFDIEAAE
ncbi:DNA translocase FtsK 4TM domain-containing protein [Methylosinus sp. Sm6]|uniref:FtsK/SpoIIIE family DNA translocase n=1 Tax=Methylosinus sp. Sm6 TaxID=2866948 RepID=UPI001C9A292C|nr:DNA translocase FtsK 4TM domain-containing protein [Methylosinus sp. Sm6]MBY6243248.1 DNA translocase FtsK 4TM domain-containing protein [Methylosinus sp. Sm6]